MDSLKNLVWMVAGLSALAILFGGYAAVPVIAQAVKAAIVRSADEGALQPYRGIVGITLAPTDGPKFIDGPAVPAGKRLVIESVSIWGSSVPADRINAIWLRVKDADPQFYVMLDPTDAERKLVDPTTAFLVYCRQVKLYYNSGEALQLVVYPSGTAGNKAVNVYLHGHFVDVL